MANHILFVFEGNQTEKQIFESLQRHYFNNSQSTKLIASYGTHIYKLYEEVKEDSYLDIFSLIKDKNSHDKAFDIPRDSVSEIFLFFDYDGHVSGSSQDKLKEMLKHFDEETESGKLYISYPMVEAIKHLKSSDDYQDTIVKSDRNYKNLVSKNSDICYEKLTTINKENWGNIVSENSKKLNFIVNGVFDFPKQLQPIVQLEVFNNQLTKFIIPLGKVAVLSSFPIFLLDYHGYEELPILIQQL
jgi:uncharacterized protein YfkK (UPF0435 family)